MNKMYLFNMKVTDKHSLEDCIIRYHEKRGVMLLEDDEDENEIIQSYIDLDMRYIGCMYHVLEYSLELISDFKLEYNKEKYPIEKILNFNIPIGDKEVDKRIRPQVRTQIIALEYILEELGVKYETTNKTDVIRLIQLLTGNEYGKTPNNTNIKQLVWEAHADMKKGYEKRVDEIEELFKGVGLNSLAKKLRNSVIT